MARAKTLYIGMRVNPQFKKPYYVAFGALSKKDAKKKEDCAYGSMYLTGYETQESYDAELAKLRADGFTVNTR